MNHASEAIIKPQIAIKIVSLHFVLSWDIEPKSILYAQIIMKITEIVAAIHIRKFIA